MRPRKTVAFWLFWTACLSLVAWWIVAPVGYAPYAWQWLLHLRYGEVWSNEQRALSDQIVLPELAAFADALEKETPADAALFAHEGGQPLLSENWQDLLRRFNERGVEIIDQPTFEGVDGDATKELVHQLFARQPYALKDLFYRLSSRLSACAPTICEHEPRVSMVYVIFEKPAMIVHWPGGNQGTRFRAGESPALSYDGEERTESWVRNIIKQGNTFETLSGDSNGFGDTMITARTALFHGATGVVAADVYWEKSQIRSIRFTVIAYAAWAALSVLALLASVVGWIQNRARMAREGDGVCVTIDIVGWSKIEDLMERFRRQRMLDSILVRAFLASTRQRVVRWSTGDGYHVLFMGHWGANMYREVLVFARELVYRWEYRMRNEAATTGTALRISIGSHGSVTMRRNSGSWLAIGDRIVSAVRIDEVSRAGRQAEGNWLTIAVEQSFKNEIKLANRALYDSLVASETGPFTETDKAGKQHTFSLLRLVPRERRKHPFAFIIDLLGRFRKKAPAVAATLLVATTLTSIPYPSGAQSGAAERSASVRRDAAVDQKKQKQETQRDFRDKRRSGKNKGAKGEDDREQSATPNPSRETQSRDTRVPTSSSNAGR